MSSLLIRQGRVIDPDQGLDQVTNILIEEGHIAQITDQEPDTDQTLEAAGWIVSPGFIDTHVAVREPGHEEDETVSSVTEAALHGGFTTIGTLPDTQPVVDDRAAAEFVTLQAERAGFSKVVPLGAITKNHEGQELAEIGQLVDGGAGAFTDARLPITNSEIMRRALQYTAMFQRPIFHHPQVPELIESGVTHEGFYSTKLGLRGMPAASEEIMTSRDIALVELTGGRLHEMCLSTAAAVDQIRRAKARGLNITADVTPHHLLLTDAEMEKFDTNYKVLPPLRDEQHINALIEGLKDGSIDAISADHQPRAEEKKTRELDQAPFGIVGLETLLPICIKALIEPGHLTWPELIDKLTTAPARILNLTNRGHLRPGAHADLCLFHPEETWTIDAKNFKTLSHNTPFNGWEVRGRVKQVIVSGQVHHIS